MRRPRLCIVFVAVMLLIAGITFGQDYKVGDRVVVIADTKLRVPDNNAVDDGGPGLVLQVGAVNGKWLWLSQGKPGWLDRRHVIPLNRAALDRLIAMIKADPRSAAL